ncbi:hypothetical protein ACFQ0B_39240 [Nonomuraea thailandensis]
MVGSIAGDAGVLGRAIAGGADVVLQVSADLDELVATARACEAAGIVLGQALARPAEVWLSQVRRPSQTAGESGWHRLAGLPAAAPAAPDEDLLVGPVPTVVAAVLALACFSHVTGLDTSTERALTRIDLRSLDTLPHRFLPHPLAGGRPAGGPEAVEALTKALATRGPGAEASPRRLRWRRRLMRRSPCRRRPPRRLRRRRRSPRTRTGCSLSPPSWSTPGWACSACWTNRRSCSPRWRCARRSSPTRSACCPPGPRDRRRSAGAPTSGRPGCAACSPPSPRTACSPSTPARTGRPGVWSCRTDAHAPYLGPTSASPPPARGAHRPARAPARAPAQAPAQAPARAQASASAPASARVSRRSAPVPG